MAARLWRIILSMTSASLQHGMKIAIWRSAAIPGSAGEDDSHARRTPRALCAKQIRAGIRSSAPLRRRTIASDPMIQGQQAAKVMAVSGVPLGINAPASNNALSSDVRVACRTDESQKILRFFPSLRHFL